MYELFINTNKELGHINPEIQGHFSEHLGRCIYEGVYVGENSDIPNTNGMRNDVVEALKEMKIPVLRWPGGCFADEYHWKDGIGPKESRKKMINTNWGGVTEDNSFGTHEFMELAEQLGCKTYVNGNVGSGTVREMSEWVEYMTFDGVSPMADLRRANGREKPWTVDYFAVGNETWGCGGNMVPEYYANLYKQYQTFVKQYNKDKKIKKLAVGPTDRDYNWTETLLKECFRQQGSYPQNFGYMDGLTLHYYTIPYDWDHKGSAVATIYWSRDCAGSVSWSTNGVLGMTLKKEPTPASSISRIRSEMRSSPASTSTYSISTARESRWLISLSLLTFFRQLSSLRATR